MADMSASLPSSDTVRTRLFVAAPALIAAAALVTFADPAASTAPGTERTIDPAAFRPLTIDRPIAAVTTNLTEQADPASAARLSDDTVLLEPGRAVLPSHRPETREPNVKPTVVAKSAWRTAGYSWYGPGFYGSGTACGQTYSRTILGVANRSLPCGTLVTLQNPANGRTITVPVIDRGPYVDGRMWDLSRGTCEALRNCYTGTIRWRLP
jgi:rare lipoprotein A (peptidoglycan hydrolase)